MSIKATKIIFIFIGLGLLFKLVGPLSGLSKQQDLKDAVQITNTREIASYGAAELVPEPLVVDVNSQNAAKINGLWALVRRYEVDKSYGKERELALPPKKENQFYIQLRKSSIVWMTQLTGSKESEKEYTIVALSAKSISVFQKLSDNKIEMYDLTLIELDERNRKVINKNNKEDGMIVLELREMYDTRSQQIINVKNPNHEIEGSVEIENNKITRLYVSVNNFELNPTELTNVGKGDYNYTAENREGALIMGKAQAAFINKNEFNLYFISGAYKGYTLIFSRKLSDEQRYEQDNKNVELEDKKLSRESDTIYVDENMGEEEAADAQQNAVAQRQHLVDQSTQRNPANASEQDSKMDARQKRVNELLVAWNNGEELTDEESDILEEHLYEVSGQGGFNFSQD